jgi:hypothetical protein
MKVSANIGGEFQIAGIIVRIDVNIVKELTESHHTDFAGDGIGIRA